MRKILKFSFCITVFALVCAVLVLFRGSWHVDTGGARYGPEKVNEAGIGIHNETDPKEMQAARGNSVERILECYSRVGWDNPGDTWDRLLALADNADKLKVLLISARIGHERIELIKELAMGEIDRNGVEKICRILEECLTGEEMKLLADMAEKYTELLQRD